MPDSISNFVSTVHVELPTDDQVQRRRAAWLRHAAEAMEGDGTAMFSRQQSAQAGKRLLAEIIASDMQTAELIRASSLTDPEVDIEPRVGRHRRRLFVRMTFDGATVRGNHGHIACRRCSLHELLGRKDVKLLQSQTPTALPQRNADRHHPSQPLPGLDQHSGRTAATVQMHASDRR
jgi:hypothetical protein